MKIITSIISLFVGLFIYGVWIVGSHDHIRFRPNMLTDWILGSMMLVCFVVPTFLFILWLKYKKSL